MSGRSACSNSGRAGSDSAAHARPRARAAIGDDMHGISEVKLR